ncbi:uncharacterized protein LOC8270916 [Ricinus communis]|uniref:Binding protein n=1 Tax=Ricinus communis TaxID=3988 RepID=B9RGE1_RICCO|nr:uncharacterized protein LOC8270916 [Ricinus communis]EEF49596.1 conserved hypothetical protein [Ricinus communis]|eukprot:XP_002513093.1 uncharacterized protein LOC8270916 [Ricinus communis]
MSSLHLQPSFFPFIQKPTTTSLLPSKTSFFKVSFSLNPSNAESSQNPPESTPEPDPDPVKLAFEKAKAYKKTIEETKKAKLEQNPVEGSAGNNGKDKEVPVSVKVAMEKAREYKKNQVVGTKGATESEMSSGLKARSEGNLQRGSIEKTATKKDKLSISSIDFMGLNFADKKTGRGLPAGLAPVIDPFPEGNLPEVEIIVGDTDNFDDPTTSMPKPSQDESSDVYKPKVSTWGVFPRPGNISKTFGGGRTIRPGDVLETAEERAAKDDRTKQLLAAYRKKMGLSIDPKIKFECEKALKDGDSLMDSGKLKEAVPYYQKVIDKLPFQSELHGLAALQWSICQDSLSRQNEAQAMYEKLQSHPNAKVSKKARQFMFSFQAMEMLKVTGSSFLPESTGYQNYFEAFVEDKTKYSPGEGESEEEGGGLSQALPYVLFLVSPVFIVLLMAVQGGSIH